MEKRTKIAASADAKRTILAELLPTDQKGDEALSEWENRITVHMQAAADEGRVEFDAEALKRVKAELESLEERQRRIQSALLQGSRKLHGVEVKAKELGVLDSSPPCRTTQELDHIGALIDQFCDRIEHDQRIAQDAIAICGIIEAEERARVSDLFGPQSPVTGYVSAITGGRYNCVEYDAARNHVYLTTAEGGRVPADFLSGGAYDQLYLAIRITIATRLLADEKGFLILDDPFIKADPERLESMMGMLRGLVEDGWQILYFSAKEEVAQALAGDIRDGRVRLFRLETPAPEATSAQRGLEDDRTEAPGASQGKLALTETPDDAHAAGGGDSKSIL
jgi:DNA repair exonuclease SbcCD ATPase subunit